MKRSSPLPRLLVTDNDHLPGAWGAMSTVERLDWWNAVPADTIIGTRRDDSLAGTAGDDFINGKAGSDTMVGGTGDDTYVVDSVGDQAIELTAEGTDTVKARVNWTLSSNLENLVLTEAGALSGTGNELDNLITGNELDNVLDGAAGNDRLAGRRGNDQLLGNAGADELKGGSGDDTLNGGTDADLMTGGTGNDYYIVDDLADVVREGKLGGIDTVNSSITWTLDTNFENLTLTNPFGRTDGFGNSLGNVIRDSVGTNYIDGKDGNDTIYGGHHITFGSDTLLGGAGDDFIESTNDKASDHIDGGDGNDTLRAIGGEVFGRAGNDLLFGGTPYGHHASGNTLHGGAGNDTFNGGGFLYGDEGDDRFEITIASVVDCGIGNDSVSGTGGHGYSSCSVYGGLGTDSVDVWSFNSLYIDGGDGNDVLGGSGLLGAMVLGGLGNDTVSASGASGGAKYTVDGGEGNDEVRGSGNYGGVSRGGAGDDLVFGSGKGATVEGGEGNDTLWTHGGVNFLRGDAGADQFVLTAKEIAWENMVYIQDFESGTDNLSVSQASLAIGNGDLVIDDAVQINGPGGFDASAELVLVAADVLGNLNLDVIAAAIGDANQAYETGQTVLFTVGNGDETWALRFESNGTDATVSASELSVIARMLEGPSLKVGDLVWSQ